MNSITINSNFDERIDELTLNLMEKLLKKLELSNVSLSINLVSDEEIKNINNEYRNKDAVTDVITFPYEEVDNFNLFLEERELGDIFIALDYVYQNSVKYQHSMAREFCFVLAHGLLHLLGYDHMNEHDEEIMFKLQEELIEEIFVDGGIINEIFS